MTFNQHITARANQLRIRIQNDSTLPTVDHGESVAILLWWTFLLDHSHYTGVPVEKLAREQLEAFIAHADEIGARLAHMVTGKGPGV